LHGINNTGSKHIASGKNRFSVMRAAALKKCPSIKGDNRTLHAHDVHLRTIKTKARLPKHSPAPLPVH